MPPHIDRQLSRKLRVAVLCGGPSAERAVSLKSGAAVCEALIQLGHAVEVVDPALVDVGHFDWTRFDAAFIASTENSVKTGRSSRSSTTRSFLTPAAASMPRGWRSANRRRKNDSCRTASRRPVTY